MSAEVESGPGLSMHDFDLTLMSANGRRRTEHVAAGRQWVHFPIGLAAGDNVFQLHVDGGGLPAPNEPRVLNFRVFRLDFEAAEKQISARPPKREGALLAR